MSDREQDPSMSDSVMNEREQLIDYVLADLDPDGYGWAAGDGPTVEEIAKSLETSGWLASHDAQVRAEERKRIAAAIESVSKRLADQARELSRDPHALRGAREVFAAKCFYDAAQIARDGGGEG